MKKILFVLITLLIAAPSFAAELITITDERVGRKVVATEICTEGLSFLVVIGNYGTRNYDLSVAVTQIFVRAGNGTKPKVCK